MHTGTVSASTSGPADLSVTFPLFVLTQIVRLYLVGTGRWSETEIATMSESVSTSPPPQIVLLLLLTLLQ